MWGDQVFVTTAISSRADATFKPGLYGEGTASEDTTEHKWQVLSLDKRTGKVQWERTAYTGVPKEKRHIKATYANATPATDGRYVVAFFGSQGLYAYDLAGDLKWKRDLGRLDVGAYDDPSYEWGTASSPILYEDLVIVQCDQQKDSFLIALRLSDGEVAWRVARDELPSWATPTVYPGKDAAAAELVTNAPNFIRGYDPETGKELWRLGRSSKITAPTPVFDGDLIVVMSGRRPNAPIFVLKAGARGDITLPEGASSGGSVVWTRLNAGSYMPTPIVYGGHLYVLKNQGILSCYDLRSGERRYEQRLPEITQRLQRVAGGRRREALPAERGRRRPGGRGGAEVRAPRQKPDGPAADGDARRSRAGCCSCAANATCSRSAHRCPDERVAHPDEVVIWRSRLTSATPPNHRHATLGVTSGDNPRRVDGRCSTASTRQVER